MSELRFRLLGPLEAERGGIRLELGPRKQRAVLALLLLEANRVVPTERLIDELWGDAPPETARSALQVYVAGLRKALGEDGASLRTRSPGYVLELEPGALDLQAFTALRAEARDASEPARAAEALHEALALWRGAPLAELDGAPFGAAAAGPARGAAPGSARGSDRRGPGARPPRRPDPRAGRARGRAPVPRALPRATDARALPVGAAGRRARRVPLRARGVRRGPRNRARRRAEGTRTAGARPGSRSRRSGPGAPRPPRGGPPAAPRSRPARRAARSRRRAVAVAVCLRE